MNSGSSETNEICNRKRITVKPCSCPNPLFEQWLEEWRLEAESRNSDLQYCFGKALKSLRKYPVLLKNGQECLVLKNFGTQLAVKLDRKLTEYRRSNPSVITTHDLSSSRSESMVGPSLSCPNEIPKTNKRRKNAQPKPITNEMDAIAPQSKRTKAYVPEVGSGARAILITMLKEQRDPFYPGYMLKEDITVKAQDICDSSFTRPNPGSHYTAWNSMSTLIKKFYVIKNGNPARYALTDAGKELAKKLRVLDSGNETSKFSFSSPHKNTDSQLYSELPIRYKRESEHSKSGTQNPSSCESTISMSLHSSSKEYIRKNFISFYPANEHNRTIDDMSKLEPSSSGNSSQYENSPGYENSTSATNTFEQLIFQPDDYEIILLVDKQETKGRIKNQIIEETTRELTALRVNFEPRHLKIGDFLWVARNKENKELVLPFIVERKRMDDLGKSMKDGRFKEQKFRLRQCGLPNVIYLIEKFGTNESRLGLPISYLNQAIINTQVADKFFIKTTNNHKHSMSYLSVFTNFLKDLFKDKTLISCQRSDLPKTFDIEAEILSLQTFQGLSKFSKKNKNMRIQDMFMKHLLQLKGLSVEKASIIVQKYPTPQLLRNAFKSSSNPETLLANLTFGDLKRNIGPTLSKSVHQLYTSKILS